MNLQSGLSDDSKPKNTAPTGSQSDRPRSTSDSSNTNPDSTSNNILEFSARFKKSPTIPRTTATIASINNKIADLSQNKPSSSNQNRGISNDRIPKKEPVSGTKVRTLSAEHKAKEGGGPLVLAESYLEQGYQDAENDDYIKALFNTLLAKKVIDDYLRKNWKFSFETLFITFYNLSAIHYKLRNFEECALYIKIALMNYSAHKSCNPQKIGNKVSWFNFNALQDQAVYLKSVVARNIFRRYKCKIHLQGCIVNSQLGNSVDAFSHAVKAAKIACRLLFDSLLVAYHLYYKVKSYNDEHKKQRESENIVKTEENEGSHGLRDLDKKTEFENTPRRRRVNTNTKDDSSPNEKEKSRNEWIEYFKKIIPILEEILEKVKGKKANMPTSDGLRLLLILRKLTSESKFKEMNMKALYQDLPADHFLYTSNVMAIAQLLPIWTPDLKKNQKLQDVIEIDALIEQIVLITVSVYCISTELRFWSNTKLTNGSPTAQAELPVWKKEPLSDTRLKEASELWVGRSVSLAFVYLPHDSLLAEQIFNIYSKIYDPTKIAIPEDEEVKYNLKYLVPAKGITKLNSNFIPVIKKDPIDEIEGLEALLFLNKDLSESTTNIINDVKLFDNKAPFYELLCQNYFQDTQASDLQGLYKKFLEKSVHGSGKKSGGNKSLSGISNKSPDRSGTSFAHLRRIYLPNATQKPEDIIQNVAMTISKDKDKEKAKFPEEKKPKKKKDKEEEKNTGDSALRVMTDPTHSDGNTAKDLFSKAEIRSSVNKLRPIARLGFEDVKRNIQRKLLRGDQSAGSGAGTARGSLESPGRPFEKEGPIQVFHTETDFTGEEESQGEKQEGPRNMKHMHPMISKNHPLSQLIGDVDQRSFIRAHLKSMQEGPAKNFFGKPSVKEEARSGSPNIMKRSDMPTIAIGEVKKLKLRPKTAEKKRPPTGDGLSRLDEKLLKRVGAPLRTRVDSEGDRRPEEDSGIKISGRASVDLEDMRAKTERRTEDVKNVRSGSVGRGINVIRKSDVMIKKSKRAY